MGKDATGELIGDVTQLAISKRPQHNLIPTSGRLLLVSTCPKPRRIDYIPCREQLGTYRTLHVMTLSGESWSPDSAHIRRATYSMPAPWRTSNKRRRSYPWDSRQTYKHACPSAGGNPRRSQSKTMSPANAALLKSTSLIGEEPSPVLPPLDDTMGAFLIGAFLGTLWVFAFL